MVISFHNESNFFSFNFEILQDSIHVWLGAAVLPGFSLGATMTQNTHQSRLSTNDRVDTFHAPSVCNLHFKLHVLNLRVFAQFNPI